LNFKVVSYPFFGFLGIKKDKPNDNKAIKEPIIKTKELEYNQTKPNKTGKNTAAI
jgi:hypothetical protein